ncbi:MAG: DUF2125 domain-containing protein [Rhizomicrobium sp.]
MTYSSRVWLYAPVTAFLLLALGAVGHWWINARAVEAKLAAMNGQQAIPGVTVSWTKAAVSGIPFRLDVVFGDFLVRAQAPRGPVTWQSASFASHALDYGRSHEIFEAAGTQTLTWTGVDGMAHRLSFLPGSLRASAIADGNGLARFDLDLVGAVGRTGDGAAFTLGRGQFHMRRDPKTDALDLMLSAVALRAPATPFGDRIRKLELYSRVTEAGAFRRLLAGRAGWMDALMAWRHDRGEIVNGPFHVEATKLTADRATGLEAPLRALLFAFY